MSSEPTFENLELACAKVGKLVGDARVKDRAGRLTSALAVLEEQGLYALFLYLEDNQEDEVLKQVRKFLGETPRQAPCMKQEGSGWDAFAHLAEDLDRLLLARDLVRQVLIYGRYHARISDSDGEAQ